MPYAQTAPRRDDRHRRWPLLPGLAVAGLGTALVTALAAGADGVPRGYAADPCAPGVTAPAPRPSPSVVLVAPAGHRCASPTPAASTTTPTAVPAPTASARPAAPRTAAARAAPAVPTFPAALPPAPAPTREPRPATTAPPRRPPPPSPTADRTAVAADRVHAAGSSPALVYSGALGLTIGLTGLLVVGYRRRRW